MYSTTIGFKDLSISCVIGILPHEREKEQIILLELKVKVPFFPHYLPKNIKETINYVELAELCKKIAVKGKYELLESLAFEIIEAIMGKPEVEWVWLKIKKPFAIPSANCAYIEVERYRR